MTSNSKVCLSDGISSFYLTYIFFFFPSTKFTPSSKILHGMKNKIIKSMSYINKLIKHNIIILILTHFRCQMQVKLISNNSMTKE